MGEVRTVLYATTVTMRTRVDCNRQPHLQHPRLDHRHSQFKTSAQQIPEPHAIHLMALPNLLSSAWKLSILAPSYSARIFSLLVSCMMSRLHLAIRLKRNRDLHFSVVATLL